MKILLRVLTIIVIIAAFALPCSAKTAEEYIGEVEEILPDEYADTALAVGRGEESVTELFSEIARVIVGEMPRIFSFFLSLLGLSLFSSLVAFVPEGLRVASERAVCIVSALFVGAVATPAFSAATATVSEVSGFFSSAIPLLSAITLAGGGVKGAAAQAAGMNAALSLVGGGFGAAFSLLSGFSLAMALASSLGGEGAGTVGKYSRSLFFWIYGIGTALVMGFLSLQTLVASASDSASIRTAKYIASGSLPLVGGAVSASLSTLAAGLSYAKGVVGASAITVLLLMLLSPLAISLAYRAALSVASGLSELIGASSQVGCYKAFLSSFDLLVGIYGLSSILYVFEVVLFIRSGVAIL